MRLLQALIRIMVNCLHRSYGCLPGLVYQLIFNQRLKPLRFSLPGLFIQQITKFFDNCPLLFTGF